MRYVIYSTRVWDRTYVLHHKHHELQVLILRLHCSVEFIPTVLDVGHVGDKLLLVHLPIDHE